MKPRKLEEAFPSESLIDIWTVYQGDDDRSSGHPAWFFTSENVAKNRAKGTGWYGGDAHVEKRKAVKIGNKFYLIDLINEIDLDFKQLAARKELRKQAKAKLTPDELEAMGYKDEADES